MSAFISSRASLELILDVGLWDCRPSELRLLSRLSARELGSRSVDICMELPDDAMTVCDLLASSDGRAGGFAAGLGFSTGEDAPDGVKYDLKACILAESPGERGSSGVREFGQVEVGIESERYAKRVEVVVILDYTSRSITSSQQQQQQVQRANVSQSVNQLGEKTSEVR
jgi:hypothetical protein